MFGLPELPRITFFGNKLKSREVLTDKEVFVCFMVIAFKCFLFPSSSELPNTDYLSILQDPESTSSVDLCMLVFQHFISGVHRYNRTCKLIGRKGKGFEFSNYILAVYYLDSLDFGAIILDQAVPRVSVWNGSLIKFFSDLDHVKNNVFGKRDFRNNLPSCYLQGALQDSSKCVKDASSFHPEPACFSLVFKNNLYLRFGSTFERKIIDGIIASVQTAITVENPNVSKVEQCVTNVLEFLKISRCSENEIPKCAASLVGDMKISSEANLDVASKLGFVNQHDFFKTVTNSAVKNNLTEVFETPECVTRKTSQLCSFNTAPAMHPLRKVMSRFPHKVLDDQFHVGFKESPEFVIEDRKHDNNNFHQSISFGGFVVDDNMAYPSLKTTFPQGCFWFCYT
ncbi:uncharacterized protein [Lolium perenne]|uniref:uncharacterized protein n=1 Tax=Lolium perenne TaxID=4522 RepID=UPI003A9A10AE